MQRRSRRLTVVASLIDNLATGDVQSRRGLSTELYPRIPVRSTAAGHIYGILGGYSSPASGAACLTGSAATATDALGRWLADFVSSTNSSASSALGVTEDADGAFLFTPASDLRLRVLYMGGARWRS